MGLYSGSSRSLGKTQQLKDERGYWLHKEWPVRVPFPRYRGIDRECLLTFPSCPLYVKASFTPHDYQLVSSGRFKIA